MVRHIVMWTVKDGMDKDEVFRSVKEGFSALNGEVEGMRSLELYQGFGGFDICLESLHDDRVSLEAYQQHPVHLELKKLVASFRAQRASCDFEV
jgi:hypothetical protein